MAKTLTDITFADLLPESIKNDPTISAAAQALDSEIQAVNSNLEKPLLYARLDELPEPIVDHLAWQLHVDFWEPDLPIERKRDLVRQSIAWHKYKGTVWAVRQALIWAGFGDAQIKEHKQLIQDWITAGGAFIDGGANITGAVTLSSGTSEFKFMTTHWAEFGIRADAAEITLLPAEQSRVMRMVETAKPARSHLVGLSFYAAYWFDIDVTVGMAGVVNMEFAGCKAAHVPRFDIIGNGCSQIGGTWAANPLKGILDINGSLVINNQRPDGESLDRGHWGTWSAVIRPPEYNQTAGPSVDYAAILDPHQRMVPDYLDGSHDLSVQTLSGTNELSGKLDLSVRPITRATYDMLDGHSPLGEYPGQNAVWHTGWLDYWHGNQHYREAI